MITLFSDKEIQDMRERSIRRRTSGRKAKKI